jgi:hypothetical protein
MSKKYQYKDKITFFSSFDAIFKGTKSLTTLNNIMSTYHELLEIQIEKRGTRSVKKLVNKTRTDQIKMRNGACCQHLRMQLALIPLKSQRKKCKKKRMNDIGAAAHPP